MPAAERLSVHPALVEGRAVAIPNAEIAQESGMKRIPLGEAPCILRRSCLDATIGNIEVVLPLLSIERLRPICLYRRLALAQHPDERL
jgi:hypothetical protein